jgi:hypothetical protein
MSACGNGSRVTDYGVLVSPTNDNLVSDVLGVACGPAFTLITHSTCVGVLDSTLGRKRIAGDCQESGSRNGPLLYARFTRLDSTVAAIRMPPFRYSMRDNTVIVVPLPEEEATGMVFAAIDLGANALIFGDEWRVMSAPLLPLLSNGSKIVSLAVGPVRGALLLLPPSVPSTSFNYYYHSDQPFANVEATEIMLMRVLSVHQDGRIRMWRAFAGERLEMGGESSVDGPEKFVACAWYAYCMYALSHDNTLWTIGDTATSGNEKLNMHMIMMFQPSESSIGNDYTFTTAATATIQMLYHRPKDGHEPPASQPESWWGIDLITERHIFLDLHWPDDDNQLLNHDNTTTTTTTNSSSGDQAHVDDIIIMTQCICPPGMLPIIIANHTFVCVPPIQKKNVCNPGTFSPTPEWNNTPCKSCPPGTIAPVTGAVVCASCTETATFSDAWGTACIHECPAYYPPPHSASANDIQVSHHHCTPCPTGGQTWDTATRQCQPCPKMTAAAWGEACLPCPPNTVSDAGSIMCFPYIPSSYAPVPEVFTLARVPPDLIPIAIAGSQKNGTIWIGIFGGDIILLHPPPSLSAASFWESSAIRIQGVLPEPAGSSMALSLSRGESVLYAYDGGAILARIHSLTLVTHISVASAGQHHTSMLLIATLMCVVRNKTLFLPYLPLICIYLFYFRLQ